MTKRGYNTKEAMSYLGVQRRFFERNIAPLLDGKSVKAGTSVIYERLDLDAAWERYKLVAGSERANEGKTTWDVQRKAVFTRQKTGRMKLMHSTNASGFESLVSQLSEKQKTT